jgi:hypothetical protein
VLRANAAKARLNALNNAAIGTSEINKAMIAAGGGIPNPRNKNRPL